MQRSRQAFWIRWMEHLGKVPCNHSSKEHMALVTCFIESIIQGVSIKNKDSIRSATVKGSAETNCTPFTLYKALKDEEHIAKQ